MQNRKTLHDYGLVLIVLGVLNLFMFISTVVASLVDGTVAETLAGVEPQILVAVKVMLGVIGGLLGLIVFADVLIGIKALKVSKNPNTDKGYITAAKVFFALNLLGAISYFVSMFNMNAETAFDIVLAFASAACNVAAYAYFIKYANAVRNETLRG